MEAFSNTYRKFDEYKKEFPGAALIYPHNNYSSWEQKDDLKRGTPKSFPRFEFKNTSQQELSYLSEHSDIKRDGPNQPQEKNSEEFPLNGPLSPQGIPDIEANTQAMIALRKVVDDDF